MNFDLNVLTTVTAVNCDFDVVKKCLNFSCQNNSNTWLSIMFILLSFINIRLMKDDIINLVKSQSPRGRLAWWSDIIVIL